MYSRYNMRIMKFKRSRNTDVIIVDVGVGGSGMLEMTGELP